MIGLDLYLFGTHSLHRTKARHRKHAKCAHGRALRLLSRLFGLSTIWLFLDHREFPASLKAGFLDLGVVCNALLSQIFS